MNLPPAAKASAWRQAAPLHANVPGGLIVTQRDHWISDALTLAGATSMACGAADLGGISAPGVGWIAAAGSSAVLGRAAYGIRRNYHQILKTQLTVVLATKMDMGSRIRLTRWRGGIKGDPTRVRIRYPIERAIDPMLPNLVIDLCRQTLGAQFRVVHHDTGKGYLVLGRITADHLIAAEEDQVNFTRGSNLIRQQLGESAVIAPKYADDGHLMAFQISHKMGVRVASPARRAAFERNCSTMLPGRWRARWSLTTDEVTLELRPSLPKAVPHQVEPVTKENYWQLPYAVDEDGRLIYWDLASSSPHHMVCGKTGTGKTVEIRSLITEATREGREWPVWIIDPKRVEFMEMRTWPNVQIVATAVAEMVAVIVRAWSEMEDRYARIERREVHADDLKPLIVVLDEFRDFSGMVNAWWQQIRINGQPTRCPVFELFSSMARKGRTARVHLVLGTQRPDAEYLGGEMRDNFDSRVSLGPLSPQGAKMMWEETYIGVAIPRKIRGRGTAMDDDGRPVEAQVFWTPEAGKAERDENEADLALLDALRPPEAKHERLAVQLDEQWLAPESADPKTGRLQIYRAIEGCELVPWYSVDASEGLPESASAGIQFSAADTAASDDVDERDLDSEYDQPDPMSAGDIEAGDLIEVDGVWVMVEAAMPDAQQPDEVDISWRSFDDESGSLFMSIEEVIEVRRPFPDVNEMQPEQQGADR